jgi:hypothetical protein
VPFAISRTLAHLDAFMQQFPYKPCKRRQLEQKAATTRARPTRARKTTEMLIAKAMNGERMTIAERTRVEEKLRRDRIRLLEEKTKRRRSTTKGEIEAREVAEEKRRRLMRDLDKLRAVQQAKRKRAAQVNEASMPCSPQRQIQLIRGKGKAMLDAGGKLFSQLIAYKTPCFENTIGQGPRIINLT